MGTANGASGKGQQGVQLTPHSTALGQGEAGMQGLERDHFETSIYLGHLEPPQRTLVGKCTTSL